MTDEVLAAGLAEIVRVKDLSREVAVDAMRLLACVTIREYARSWLGDPRVYGALVTVAELVEGLRLELED